MELHYVRGWPETRGCRSGFGCRDLWVWWWSRASCAAEGALVLQLLQSGSHSNKKLIRTVLIPTVFNLSYFQYINANHILEVVWKTTDMSLHSGAPLSGSRWWDRIDSTCFTGHIPNTPTFFDSQIWLLNCESHNSSQCFHLPWLPAPEVEVPEETPETIPVRPDTIIPCVNVP